MLEAVIKAIVERPIIILVVEAASRLEMNGATISISGTIDFQATAAAASGAPSLVAQRVINDLTLASG